MTQKTKKVLIAAAGTGGHVFPGLVVADELHQQGMQVIWLGTEHGIEQQIVPQHNIALLTITIQGLRGKGKTHLMLAPFKIIRAIVQSMCIIKQQKIDLVLAMGGYVCGPIGIAAWLLRKPLLLHEQNSIRGKTNQYLSYFAKHIFTAFPYVFPQKKNVSEVGNPIRAAIGQIDPPEQRLKNLEQRRLRILILGGSQGARAINHVIPALWQFFQNKEVTIWHQTGQRNFAEMKQHYQMLSSNNNENLRYVPFISDMTQAYSWADLIICRAGALTIAELATVGVASILIPFPYAVDDHQTKNARYLTEKGAGILIPEAKLTADYLIELCNSFYHDRQQLKIMASKARALRHTNVSQKIVQLILEV